MVNGDMMNQEAEINGSYPLVRFFTRPDTPYVIEVSTNLSTHWDSHACRPADERSRFVIHMAASCKTPTLGTGG